MSDLFKYGLNALQSTMDKDVSIDDLKYACEHNYLEMAQHIYNILSSRPNISQTMECQFKIACKNGFLTMAKWIHLTWEHSPTMYSITHSYSLINACANGHLHVAKWLIYNIPHLHSELRCGHELTMACINSHLEVAEWILEIEPDAIHSLKIKTFEVACIKGNLNVAKWLSKKMNVNALTYDFAWLLMNVCKNNHLDLSNFILEIAPYTDICESIFINACKMNHHDMLVWRMNVVKQEVSFDELNGGFSEACMYGHIQIAKMLYNWRPSDICLDVTFVSCCPYSTTLESLQWISTLMEEDVYDFAYECGFEAACEHGNIEMAKWVLSQCPKINVFRNNHTIFKNACFYGLIDVVRWMVELHPQSYSVTIEDNFIVSWRIKHLIPINNNVKANVNTYEVDECPICTDCKCDVVSNQCNHSFCKQCITVWWNTSSNQCPMCRTTIHDFRDI